MTSDPFRRKPASRRLAALLASLVLAGCGTVSAPTLPADNQLTVMGRYDSLAGCVAEAAEKSVAGAATLRVDRERRQATLRRVAATSADALYEIRFTQIGATTVQVDGRSAAAPKDGAQAFAFLWPHVELCATHQMAP